MDVNRKNTDALNMYELSAKFSMDNLKTLQLGEKLSTPIGRRYLSQHVKRYPLDLRAQVQRILMNQDQDQLAGTLQDCFIALKDKGLNLRRELFEISKAKLSDENQSYFSSWLENDYASAYDDRYLQGSVLATGLTGKSEPLLVQQQRESTSYASYYQEAIDCLDYGQLEKAQELLEQELLNPDGDPRTEEELLRVYDYTNDMESKNRLKAVLESQGRELREEWNPPQQSAN
jgi:hypothetical protein